MYHEDEDEKCVRLAVWHKDGVEVEEDYISTFPLDDLSTDNPEIVCDEQDICGAKVRITYKRLRIYATIFIDFDKNVPKKVIEIAIKGSAVQKTQIVVSR